MIIFSVWGAVPLSTALLFTFSLVSAVPIAAQAEWPQLTDSTFSSSLSRGLWFVEFFSPQCSHCKKFAPTWEALVVAKTKQWGPYGFFMAQVNCLAQGDLCDANGVEAYPTLKLFRDGVEVKKFSGKRSFENVSDFIDANTREILLQKDAVTRLALGEVPNPTGEVLVLDPESLDAHKSKGIPMFVKFYAPWCSHCKHLAPKWIELAEAVKGILLIAEFNCEANKAACKKEGVPGFPQLVLLVFQGGEKTEYRGKRELASMQDWATNAVSASGVSDVGLREVEALLGRQPVFFLYMHTLMSNREEVEEVQRTAQVLLGTPPFYKTRDPDVYNLLGVDPNRGPALVAVKDHEPRAVATFSLSVPYERESTVAWLQSQKLATLAELNTHNFDEVMRNPSKPIVVLGAFDGSTSQDQAVLLQISREWRDRDTKVFNRPVVFVWMDKTKWTKWLKSMYGIKVTSGAAVVISDHSVLRYYDRDATGQKISLNQQSIFSALDGIDRGTVSSKHSENLAERTIRVSGFRSFVSCS
ncbi:thioredoxin-like protein [Dacryopinax primogenitus]|uniref:Thioredoxin-like protein n=1 Tax=Dacryopinax primogenitus (strain DJM 731) TaxID=1858805 RepID=M5GBZ6_DACPD|nr:thioredoxin-like protein [Dacryopinax primogenitus]EJU05985.1 thioredoxin-like protein [Dacryopinax primogenitus]